jgi:hypothetical protein
MVVLNLFNQLVDFYKTFKFTLLQSIQQVYLVIPYC